ncbi:5-keto-4-deoxyuronate isomerase [Verrucomicrobia bacterium IMCC26134]|jgi:4-deoxy-L-threo-5-hexosulose-uronate ketol-isomerase|nr:5-keto-4-deoxyuronate isomerase [Verrucomicrobia bacterium IMCC26134]
MKQIFTHSAAETAGFDTAKLRAEHLLSGLFQPGSVQLAWWETDRTIAAGILPVDTALELPNHPELRADFFLERREAGVVNIGGPGTITADGVVYRVAPLDAVYLGRGARDIRFASDSASAPAKFWLLSYPAHAAHPSRHVVFADSETAVLGATATANQRLLTKLIHPGAFPTCQVVMGVTRLESGSVWNTMPPHTHLRRSEVYLYFNVQPGQAVMHFMGQPQETRHLVVRNEEAVLSAPWSIHSGAGTSNYAFVWGMGGENQAFADMDPAPVADLR